LLPAAQLWWGEAPDLPQGVSKAIIVLECVVTSTERLPSRGRCVCHGLYGEGNGKSNTPIQFNPFGHCDTVDPGSAAQWPKTHNRHSTSQSLENRQGRSGASPHQCWAPFTLVPGVQRVPWAHIVNELRSISSNPIQPRSSIATP